MEVMGTSSSCSSACGLRERGPSIFSMSLMERGQVAHGSAGCLEVTSPIREDPMHAKSCWQMLNTPAPELEMHLRTMDEVASMQASSAA